MFYVIINLFSFNNYWYHPKIHNLGNTGVLGNIHALASPVITKFIDENAYYGLDIRKQVFDNINGNVLDLCCGTGFSTKPGNTGVDTSLPMLRCANLFNPGSNYIFGNAETFGDTNSYDVVTCMFALHEIPEEGHINIINNAIRISKKKIIFVDISTNYKPSNLMLSGEPYVIEYINNIDSLFDRYSFRKENLIKGHVDMWTYTKYYLTKES
jgi:SAM-dependent methyltransferase